jgi:hypothetical protein
VAQGAIAMFFDEYLSTYAKHEATDNGRTRDFATGDGRLCACAANIAVKT